MFALLRRLAGSCLLLRALVSLAGRLGSSELIGRGAARDVGGLVLLRSLSPLATTVCRFGLIPTGAGRVLRSASEPLMFPSLRIPIVHPLEATPPTSRALRCLLGLATWDGRRGRGTIADLVTLAHDLDYVWGDLSLDRPVLGACVRRRQIEDRAHARAPRAGRPLSRSFSSRARLRSTPHR